MRTFIIIAGLFVAALAYHTHSMSQEPALSPGAIRPQDAAAHIGESVKIEGIVWVHENAQATFLDLGGDYPNQALAVVIWPDDRQQFGNLSTLNGKPIAIWGEVQRYGSGLEIVAHEQRQIRVL